MFLLPVTLWLNENYKVKLMSSKLTFLFLELYAYFPKAARHGLPNKGLKKARIACLIPTKEL